MNFTETLFQMQSPNFITFSAFYEQNSDRKIRYLILNNYGNGMSSNFIKNRPPLIERDGFTLVPAPPGSTGGVSLDQFKNVPCPYYIRLNDATTSRRCRRIFCRCANKNDCARFKVAGHFKPALSKVPIL